MRVFLVDDEPLALKRLSRMLQATKRVEIVGMSTDPVDAARAIAEAKPDLVFLDIEMPEMNGFQMLATLDPQPLVIFTTAYNQYALKAFEVNSVDYLLKPIEPDQLDRALNKLDRLRAGSAARPDIRDLLAQVAAAAGQLQHPEYMERIGSRTGERIEFVPVTRVSHFFSGGKLTHAATAAKNYVVDATIDELEHKLDPKKFVRIHRSSILNLDYLHELHSWFGGRMLVRLKDEKHTELTVARDRVKELKARLGV